MTLSLSTTLIPAWLQTLGAGLGWLDKAASSGIAEQELLEARLIDDMLPFGSQVKAMAVHSQGAVEGVREGVFRPRFQDPNPASIAELPALLDEAIAFVQGLTEEEMQGFVGQDMRFEIGEKRLDFTAENFLLSFSLPNFFFHATTAYGILRAKGLPLGKIDYLGQLRLKKD